MAKLSKAQVAAIQKLEDEANKKAALKDREIQRLQSDLGDADRRRWLWQRCAEAFADAWSADRNRPPQSMSVNGMTPR